MQEIESLQTVSYKIRAIAHVLFYADYVQEMTDDPDFFGSLTSAVADSMYLLADRCQKSFDVYDAEEQRQSEKIQRLREQLVKFHKLADGELVDD